MNEDILKKVFRTRMGNSALQTYRDLKMFGEMKSNGSLLKDLFDLFSEVESKYNLLENENEKRVLWNELLTVLHDKIGDDSISAIGGLMSIGDDDVWLCLGNTVVDLLGIFHTIVDGVKSKEHINYYAYSQFEYAIFAIYGLFCNNSIEHQTESFLSKVTDRYSYGFFDTFEIKEELVYSYLNKIDPLEILKYNRDFAFGDMAKAYLENYDQANEEYVLENLNRFLNSSKFLPINDVYYILSRNILRQGNIDLWIELIIKMKYPILQDAMLFVIDDSVMFGKIANRVIEKQSDVPRFIIFFVLLRSRWLQCLIENAKNIKESANIKGSEEENEFIRNATSKWDDVLSEGIDAFVKINLKLFSKTEFSKWCLKKNLYDNLRKTAQSEANNIVIGRLWDSLFQTVNWKELDTTNGDYRFILFCISNCLKEGETDHNKLMELAQNMETAINRDDFLWSMNLNEASLNEMRSWIGLISLLDKEYPLELLRRNLTVWEGYNTSPLKNIYKQQRKECFVMSTLALLFEKDDYFDDFESKLKLFEKIAQNVVMQCHCCVFDRDISQYYYQPLLILELVANQIFEQEKDWYNWLLLQKLDDFCVLIKILAEGNATLTDEAMMMLANRKTQEWKYIRAKMEETPQTKHEISFYEEEMVKLGI